ncbi:Mediator of RNA polymerase II transcription subunit 11 [Chamberlinius hualienensis]
MATPLERLEQLEAIEKDIANVLHHAGQAILEMSKDKTNLKQMECHTANFLKTLETVEVGLSKQIGYLTQVSTGQPHEGSSYASQKVLQMAWHRLEHARSKIADLEKLRNQHMQSRPPLQRLTMPPTTT